MVASARDPGPTRRLQRAQDWVDVPLVRF